MTKNEKPKKIYRVWYRARLADNSPVVGELNIKTDKEKWDIDFEETTQKYLKIVGTATFDEIINTEVIG